MRLKFSYNMKSIFCFVAIVFVSTKGQTVDYCQPLGVYPDPTLIRSSWQQVFNDDFNGPAGSTVDGTRWQSRKTSAFEFSGAYEGGTRNPGFGLLDIIDQYRVFLDGNGWVVFDAWETSEPFPPDTSKNFWVTGLLTTEWSATGHPFKVRTGDYIETVFKFPYENGSWPALWTWGAGNYGTTDPWQEVDSFEYHPDKPHTLEFTSHVHVAAGEAKNFYNPTTITPGSGVKIGTHYGENAITWYLNDCRAYSTADGKGVGPYFDAYILLNLSIHAGLQHHPAPNPEVNNMQFKADYVKVWRKNCNTNIV